MKPALSLFSYLLSAHAAVHAGLVLLPGRAALHAGLLGAGAAAGILLHDLLESWAEDQRFRWRVLIAGGAAYGLILASAFSAIVGGSHRDLAVAVEFLIFFQAAFLAFAGASRGGLALLQNAFVLAVIGALPGGVLAALALGGHALLMVLWLILDHHARLGARAIAAARAAAGPALATAALFAAAFLLLPPAAYRPPGRASPLLRLSPERMGDLSQEYAKLLAAILGSVALLLAAWQVLRRLRPEGGRRNVETVLPVVSAATPIPRGEAYEEPPPGDARGRVIRCYLDFLRRAARLGFSRRPDATPREFARRLPEVGVVLTELFMRARYGREEPSEKDLAAAEEAAGEALARLRLHR